MNRTQSAQAPRGAWDKLLAPGRMLRSAPSTGRETRVGPPTRLRAVLLLLAIFGAHPAAAGTSRYFYDSSGRLIGVTAESSIMSSYNYDAANNRTRSQQFPNRPPQSGDRLGPDEMLIQGQQLRSQNGTYALVFQEDSNLVLYKSGVPIWASNTSLRYGSMLVMQGDGNLVLYDPQFNGLWGTGTHGNPGAHLKVQDDGNLVVYTAQGVPIWASNTAGI